jgi:hypothetical protein
MYILSRLFVGFIDKKRIDVVADMILSPLGFVLTFILRYTGVCVILARTARPTVVMSDYHDWRGCVGRAMRAFSWCE